ncbi:MAG: TonB family protein [Gammaproteobacteria bacterium]|nr:TonB family protein [Gammaproteobacteria bacterium]
MRFFVAFSGALGITIALFIFMQLLIENRQNANTTLPVFEPIEILPPKQLSQQPETPPAQQEQAEPRMDELLIPTPSPQPSINIELPDLDLKMGDLKVQTNGNRWNTPLSAEAVNILEEGGAGAQGYVEVVPIGTRMPNVPELAWKNKIDGWVLVAFNVKADGRTKNIRVLDANPRGVFEEKVIAAVEDWMYSVQYFGELKGDIVLTQKVDVEWKNYPSNVLDMDQ